MRECAREATDAKKRIGASRRRIDGGDQKEITHLKMSFLLSKVLQDLERTLSSVARRYVKISK